MCFAVGSSHTAFTYDKPLVERWNGTSWSVVASPNPTGNDNRLNGISCSTTTTCFAVGEYREPAVPRTLWSSGERYELVHCRSPQPARTSQEHVCRPPAPQPRQIASRVGQHHGRIRDPPRALERYGLVARDQGRFAQRTTERVVRQRVELLRGRKPVRRLHYDDIARALERNELVDCSEPQPGGRGLQRTRRYLVRRRYQLLRSWELLRRFGYEDLGRAVGRHELEDRPESEPRRRASTGRHLVCHDDELFRGRVVLRRLGLQDVDRAVEWFELGDRPESEPGGRAIPSTVGYFVRHDDKLFRGRELLQRISIQDVDRAVERCELGDRRQSQSSRGVCE